MSAFVAVMRNNLSAGLLVPGGGLTVPGVISVACCSPMTVCIGVGGGVSATLICGT